MASVHLLWNHHIQVTPATIRQWGQRHEGLRRSDGQYRYDLEAVISHARKLGLLEDL